jgi:hypothetical protein
MSRSVTLEAFSYTISVTSISIPCGWVQLGHLQINKVLSVDGTTITLNECLPFEVRVQVMPCSIQPSQVYILTTGNQTVANANGFLALQLTNPANSGKTISIHSVRATATAATTLSLYKNATLNVTGTAATPHNTNWGLPDASVVTGSWVSQTANPTSGGVLLQTINQTDEAMEISLDEGYILPSMASDQTFYILLQNSATDAILSINVDWSES